MESGDMRGYRIVTRTFRQSGANPQRLTSSSAPFVILTRGVRWQAEIPCGHSHLSATEANESDDIRMMLVVRFWLFSKKFVGFFTLVVWRHSSPTTHEIILYWARAIEFDGVGKCRGCPTLLLSRHWSFVDTSYAFSFLSEWQVPLVEILIGRTMLRSNEISVLSLLGFYLR